MRIIRFYCYMDHSSSSKEFHVHLYVPLTLAELADSYLGCKFEMVSNDMLINNTPVSPGWPMGMTCSVRARSGLLLIRLLCHLRVWHRGSGARHEIAALGPERRQGRIRASCSRPSVEGVFKRPTCAAVRPTACLSSCTAFGEKHLPNMFTACAPWIGAGCCRRTPTLR